MSDYPKLRASPTCPLCRGTKSNGLLLCWPCHRKAKHAADGGYPRHVEYLLGATESALASSLNPMDRCFDDRTAISACPNAACRWSGRCNIEIGEAGRRR